MDIQLAIRHLRRTAGLQLPHGFLPGSYPGGIDLDFDEARWTAYQWNPPAGLADDPEFAVADPNASPKPTWAALVAANAVASLANLRADKLQQANDEATRRIALTYHAGADLNPLKEFQERLSGRDQTANDAERVRLVSVCHALEARIEAATTEAELTAIDPSDDTEWGDG